MDSASKGNLERSSSSLLVALVAEAAEVFFGVEDVVEAAVFSLFASTPTGVRTTASRRARNLFIKTPSKLAAQE
jgi:hypothetical protein